MQIKEVEAKIQAKYLLALLNTSLDLAEASDEQPFLDSMSEGSDIYDTINRWNGIEKKQKQQAYFVLEDTKKLVEECKLESCTFKEEWISLQRAIETNIKSLEQADVQESNQLGGLSSEILWKNFWQIISNLTEEKISQISEDDANNLADRYHSIAVFDYTEREKWCKSVQTEYSDFARYKHSCGYDFVAKIKNLSTGIEDRDFNDVVLSSMISACQVEQKLKGILDSACPHITLKNTDVRLKADAYLANLTETSASSAPINKTTTNEIRANQPSTASEPTAEPYVNELSPTQLCTNKHGFFARYDIKTGQCDCAVSHEMINGKCI